MRKIDARRLENALEAQDCADGVLEAGLNAQELKRAIETGRMEAYPLLKLAVALETSAGYLRGECMESSLDLATINELEPLLNDEILDVSNQCAEQMRAWHDTYHKESALPSKERSIQAQAAYRPVSQLGERLNRLMELAQRIHAYKYS